MGLNRFRLLLEDRARLGIALAAILTIAALAQGASYWPGIMTWDSINQYGQATKGAFDDWHPPAMAWLWRQFIPIAAGPAPMLLLQLALYWGGYGLIIAAALRRKLPIAAIAITAVALMPFPLAWMGAVLKDCLLLGCLLSGIGFGLWGRSERNWPCRIAAMALLLYAATLRFNGFLALLPLLVWIMPQAWRRTRLRTAAIAAAWLAVLLLAMPVANRLIGASKSHVELSLVIFDLGGITLYSGKDMFPPVGVADPVAVNAGCYNPVQWDSYSYWVDMPCPIGFYGVRDAMERSGAGAYPTLVHAVLAHPLAYARHRLRHFNINTRFLVHDEVQAPTPERGIPNDWHFTVDRTLGLRLVSRLTDWTTRTPLGWPIWWIAVAGGLLAISARLPSHALILPIALSAFLYGLGYLPFSVSSELRYHLWTIVGAAIATAFALSDMLGGARVPRARLIASFAPAVLIGLLCTIWRLT